MPVVLDPRRGRFRAFHGEDWILFGLPVGARQVAETDLKGRSTGRSGTSFVAADAQYGRGRPCDARGAYWGGRDGRLETFFPAKNDGRLTQWHSQEKNYTRIISNFCFLPFYLSTSSNWSQSSVVFFEVESCFYLVIFV